LSNEKKKGEQGSALAAAPLRLTAMIFIFGARACDLRFFLFVIRFQALTISLCFSPFLSFILVPLNSLSPIDYCMRIFFTVFFVCTSKIHDTFKMRDSYDGLQHLYEHAT
jgi:hypothetical protein